MLIRLAAVAPGFDMAQSFTFCQMPIGKQQDVS
jgi:hypothetical protein